jgi:hypothetical protein
MSGAMTAHTATNKVIGARVLTPNGIGVIKDIEHYSRVDGGINRYGVELKQNPFFYPVAYYWPHEVSALAKAGAA